MSRHAVNFFSHSNGRGSSIIRVALLSFASLFLAQQTISQGPAVNSLSSGLAEIASHSGRKTVAVVDFTDLQGCVTELGRYMAEDVSVALVNNAKGFEVIDRTNLKVLMQEHKLASTGIIDPATARKLGQVAGVDALVTGTIAPLSDSVHVSAKVLDTETAKMLGGITGDIPRTRTVEDLLAKGVANCGSTPSSPGTSDVAQGQGGVTPIQRPPTVVTAQVGDFVFSIEVCRRAGDRVRCSGSVLNQNAVRRPLRLTSAGSFMIDNLGNQSRPGGGAAFGGFGAGGANGFQIQLGSDGEAAELEPDIPLNVSLSAKGLSDVATSVSLVLSVSQPSGKVTLRSIPIQAK